MGRLPTDRLLRYYKNKMEQKSGIDDELVDWMVSTAESMGLLEEGELLGGLAIDGMKIQVRCRRTRD